MLKSAAFLILLGSHGWAEDPRVAALVAQGDAADRQHQTKAAITAFQQAEAIDPRNAGVLLRLSKQLSDLGTSTKAPEVAKASHQKALGYAQRAAELDPKSAKAHLSLAVCYGKLTDHVSNKVKLEYSRVIRAETQKSLDLDATDDFAWHVMGRWHFGIANIGAVQRTLAKLVYGDLPEATNEEAARCLKKATELAPQRVIHHAELAKVYTAMGKADLAAQSWQNVLGLKAADHEDVNYQKAAKLALDAGRAPRATGPRMLSDQTRRQP